MNLIISPFHDYRKWEKEGFRTRDAHLFEHFKTQGIDKILVIDRPITLAERIIKHSKKAVSLGRIVKKTREYQITEVARDVFVLDIFSSQNIRACVEKKAWWYSIFNNKNTISTINRTFDFLDMRKDRLLLLQNPMAIGLVKNIKFDGFIFDGIDDWLYHPQMKNIRQLVKQNYDYIDKNADFITSVSKSLLTEFPNNKHKQFIPNGVDVGFFSEALCIPKGFEKNVGYVGKIQNRFDFELVEKTASENKECQFWFAGPLLYGREIAEKLQKKHSNVHFVGNISYEKLPFFLRDMDACIIPHIVDSFTNSMNPLKVYEYLACGKRVVSTTVSGIDVSKYVYCFSKDDFSKGLQDILLEECPNPVEVVNSIPKEYYWSNIAEQFIAIMREIIDENQKI